MTWEEIYQRALTKSHTDEEDYTREEADLDMDIRFQEIVDAIVEISKDDNYWDKWVADTVVWQSEYVAEKLWVTPDDLDIKKINKVFVRYTEEQSYPTPVTYRASTALDYHPDYYKDNQPTSAPFFYIQDNSIFIYPAPTVAITEWLELRVIHKPAAINTDSTEDEIELQTQFHKVISDWLRIDIFLWQDKEQAAQLAEAKYEKWLAKIAAIMKARYNKPVDQILIVPNNMR